MCDFCENGKKIENGYTYGNAFVKKEWGVASLYFDNSGDEYGEGRFEVNYCPLCGRKLSEETEKPSTEEILANLKEKMTEDNYKTLQNGIKLFSDGVNALWEALRKGIETES